MGQFKPMVKMETTEPSVILKLKKGGHVRMKSKGANGHSPMKKMGGGPMGDMGAMNSPAMIRPPVVGGPSIGSPRRPSMAQRQKMMALAKMMQNRRPPAGGLPVMKNGGKAKGGEVETPAMHKMEMKGIKGIGKQLKSHESKPASKAHAGLKNGGKACATGGVVKGQGGYKTGGVVLGAGGFKKGGMATGGVSLGNAGGFKKGGAAKKFAKGGSINSGRAVSMPQGHKKPTPSVATNLRAGTFKNGGSARMAGGGIAGLTGNYQAPDLTSMSNTPAYPRDPNFTETPVVDSEGRPSRPLDPMTPMQPMTQGGGGGGLQNTINNTNTQYGAYPQGIMPQGIGAYPQGIMPQGINPTPFNPPIRRPELESPQYRNGGKVC